MVCAYQDSELRRSDANSGRSGRPSLPTVIVITAGVILGITGFAKAYSVTADAKALDYLDPLLGLSFRKLMLLVGLGELLIAVLCFSARNRRLSLAAVAWLATSILVYRVGLWYVGWHRPCHCMGTLTDALHITPAAADNLMKIILIYLVVASYSSLLLWQRGRWAVKPDTAAARFRASPHF